jgi:hypothetical protein
VLAVLVACACACACSCGPSGDAPAPSSAPRRADPAPATPAPPPPETPAAEGFARIEAYGLAFEHAEGATTQSGTESGVVTITAAVENALSIAVIANDDLIEPPDAFGVHLGNLRVQTRARGDVLEEAPAPRRRIAGAERDGTRIVVRTDDGIRRVELFSLPLADLTVSVVLDYPESADADAERQIGRFGETLVRTAR